jgi:hypothetical protein
LNDDGNFYFTTYTFEYNFGSDNVDRWTTIDHGDDLMTDWIWIYYGYDPENDRAISYCRFRDREVIEYQEDNNHFIPKYFGLYLGNVEG